MRLSAALAALALGVGAAAATPSRCRCLAGDPCWDSVPWDALNTSVQGRLLRLDGPASFSACAANGADDDRSNDDCAAQLANSDNEHWLSSRADGYLHVGQYAAWNISSRGELGGGLSSFAVAAETEQDMQLTVAFALRHNLRLVVKGTGHDWYGRSSAGGSLMLWTHKRKAISFHDALDHNTGQPVPAVSVQTGVQVD